MAGGEKRMKSVEDSIPKASIVLVDIEGTTTSISFVKDTLFPYIRNNLESYVKAHWNDAEFQDDLVLLKEQVKQDETDKVDGVIIPENNEDSTMEAVVRNVLWQMDLDRKTKALKQLQGHIAREGYKNGTLKGHVYSDVVPALKSWARSGRQIYVYSSGSVEAQKLLFGHSEEGDLLELFAGHFDTSVGPKVESASYVNIVKQLECRSEDILFLTDVPREAKAAEGAGLKAVVVVREGNEPLTEEDKMNFAVIKSFQDFVFEASTKRKKMSVHDEPHVIVESPTNEASNSDKVKTVDKTAVASLESGGSVNAGSSICAFEMMDVSSNDPQDTNIKTDRNETEPHGTDDTKLTVGVGGTKVAGKTELDSNGSEVSKKRSSPADLKTVEAADTKKESPKPCSKHAEGNDSGSVSETADVKIKSPEADVEVTKVETDVELKDIKADHSKANRDVETTKAGNTVDITEMPANIEGKKEGGEEAENTEYSTHNTDIDLNTARSVSAVVGSEGLEIGSEDTTTNFGDATTEAGAGDQEENVDVEAASGHEEANLKGAEADVGNKNVDDSRVEENINIEMSEVNVDSTQTEGKMGAVSGEVKNYADVNACDAKGAEVMDTDNMASQMKAKVTGEMRMESLGKLGEKDEALRKVMDVKSEESAWVKEEGERSELSENLSVTKEVEDVKLQCKVTDKTESDITLHKLPEQHSVNDSSADKCAPGDNKCLEIVDAEHSKHTVELNEEVPATVASQESSSEPQSAAHKILQSKTENISNTVENISSELSVSACNVDIAEADTNSNQDIMPVESNNEEEKGADESSAVGDLTKENGLSSTAENGKDDDISNNCPDPEQNGELGDVKVKKMSADGSGNKDEAAPITGVESS